MILDSKTVLYNNGLTKLIESKAKEEAKKKQELERGVLDPLGLLNHPGAQGGLGHPVPQNPYGYRALESIGFIFKKLGQKYVEWQ